MEYIVNGGNKLKGEIAVYGAKNCALALLGATVLTSDEIVLNNCPEIIDVTNMLKLLVAMGKKVERCGDTVIVKGELTSTCAPKAIATLLRGSALILGGTVARYGQIALPLPGGCSIGSRPMDIHLNGLEKMGVCVLREGDMVSCKGKPRAADYTLRFASVGATENLLCACALINGRSVLSNCAVEPEVVALEQLLVKMGAKLSGIGTNTVTIDGVKTLHGATFDVIPDRIVAATYLSAIVATLGEGTVKKCNPKHMQAFLQLLKSRFDVKTYDENIYVKATAHPYGYGKIVTAPYPLFPTDMQSLVMSLAACCHGQTEIDERLFENRLAHNAEQLNKMGANISVRGSVATINGEKLHGAGLLAKDLRGGAGLVIAALSAEGQSIVGGVEHIDRGYVTLAENLSTLGADIRFCI